MATRELVFVDTSGWIATLLEDDQSHDDAVQLWEDFRRERRRIVTTDWVFAETGNGLARTRVRLLLPRVIRSFFDDADCTLRRIDVDRFEDSLALYSQVNDKEWGLVDCASFVVMRELRIQE